jgi:hypothetical protein
MKVWIGVKTKKRPGGRFGIIKAFLTKDTAS